MNIQSITSILPFSANAKILQTLLIFYLIIGSTMVNDLYSGQLVDFIKNNRYVKHFIGLSIMTLILSNINNKLPAQKAVLYSVISYVLFVLSTKMDLHWSLAFIGLLMAGYLYESNMTLKEQESENDQALGQKDKQKIKTKHENIKMIIIISVVLVILFGSYQYFDRKQIQHGGNFDATKFIFARNTNHFA